MKLNIKKAIKSFFHRLGFDVVRYVPTYHRPFNVLEYIIWEYVSKMKPFFFVQIGANDGVMDDPLRDSICRYKLNGLLVEPQHDIYDKLRENYKDQPQLLFENCAISNNGKSFYLYRAKSDPQIGNYWYGQTSFSRKHLINQGIKSEDIVGFSVPSLTLEQLITKHAIQEITLLQVDTEGYDSQIVRSALETGIFPNIINYEHCHLFPSERLKLKHMLNENDYQFIEVRRDTLAVRKIQ